MSQKPVKLWVQQEIATDGATVRPGTYRGREVELAEHQRAYFLTLPDAEIQVTDHVRAGTIAVQA